MQQRYRLRCGRPNACVSLLACTRNPPTPSDGSGGSTVNMRDDTTDVHDNVDIFVGKCADVIISRTANAVGGSASGDLNARDTYFRASLFSIVEFADLNNDGHYNEGDRTVDILEVSSLTCSFTRTSSTAGGVPCVVITLTDSTGQLALTATICAASVTIGSKNIPQRSTKVTTSISRNWEARADKIALIYNIYTKSGDTVTWDATKDALYLDASGSGNKGEIDFEATARSADATFDINYDFLGAVTDPSSVSAQNSAAGETKTWKLVASIDALVPNVIIIDPVFGPGHPSASAALSASLLLVLAAILCALFGQA